MVAPLHIVAGALLLILGRQLFWVFVAMLGFVLGMDFGTQLLPNAGEPALLLVALAAGGLGAVVAYFFYHVAIAVGGFLAGGRVLVALMTSPTVSSPQPMWLAFIAGGVIGAVLLLLVFDWALILLSSLLGASIVAPHLATQSSMTSILFIVLTVAGIAVQAAIMHRRL